MSDDPLALIIVALAGWRVAYMLTNEDGPANVCGWLRRHVAESRDGGFREVIEPGSLDKLFTCVYCMSFWTTVAAALLWAVDIDATRDGITLVAAWGAATALDMIARKD